jgi:hypothetical protein
MVAGAALTAMSGGALSPVAASLMVGGAGAVATGSLSKGLMMGLGAYGGAGLGAGLGLGGAGAGASSLASAGAAQNAANLAANATNLASTTPWGGLTGAAGGAGASTAAFNPTANAIATATGTAPLGSPLPVQPNVSPWGGMPQTNAPVVASDIVSPTTGLPIQANAPASSVFEKIKSMPGKAYDLLTSSGKDTEKQREELKKYLLASGVSAASLYQDYPELRSEEEPLQADPNARYGVGEYRASVRPGNTGERTYSFFADGGFVNETNPQMGQSVEKMSQLNSVGANTNYPMANIKPFGYSVPKNYPVSQNVFQPDNYQRVDPYTGEQKFAGGGLATLHFKSGGAFISKLKPVTAPKKTTPKLADTKKLETELANLKKYGSYDDQMSKYNDLANQIKERQADKANKAKELAERQKSYNSDLAKMKAEQANRTKEINNEYASKVKSFNAETASEVKNRQASISKIKDKTERANAQKDLANFQKERSSELTNINKEKSSALSEAGNDVKTFTDDFNKFKTDVSQFNKNIETQISQAAKEQTEAKKAAGFAKQRAEKQVQFEKIQSSNQQLVDKANEAYESGVSKLNEYQNALKDEQEKWEEQTKREATGISSLRAQPVVAQKTSASSGNQEEIKRLEKQLDSLSSLGSAGERGEINRKIEALKSGTSGAATTSAGVTTGYMKDPITGKLVPYEEQAAYKKYTKAPGYDTSTRIMDESDINNLFQDVAGRRPTEEELQKYLGAKTTDAALAGQIMKLPDVSGKTTFADEDLVDNFKYYLGREPNSGELANMKKSNLTNFNSLRNYLQAQPAYVENLNNIGAQMFQTAVKAQEKTALQEYRANAPISADEVSTAYQDALGRKPNIDEIKQYMNTNILPQELESQLRSSDEYLNSLTKPLVPDLQQYGSINAPSAAQTSAVPPINFTSYSPHTALEYTPESLGASNVGAVSGLMATPTGMQMPQDRSPVTIQGALPLNPTGQEQLGLQTLFGQLATQAPALQTGMNFAAPTSNPYELPANPASIEAALAAIAKQKQQAAPEEATGFAAGGMAEGGYNLGGYSDGGRLLKGPGDGVSDSIPATIGNRQPARLADGEFVIPARIVSELGNGSTDAGARKLYAMMQRIQQARGKTVGRGKVAVNSRADKLLPA